MFAYNAICFIFIYISTVLGYGVANNKYFQYEQMPESICLIASTLFIVFPIKDISSDFTISEDDIVAESMKSIDQELAVEMFIAVLTGIKNGITDIKDLMSLMFSDKKPKNYDIDSQENELSESVYNISNANISNIEKPDLFVRIFRQFSQYAKSEQITYAEGLVRFNKFFALKIASGNSEQKINGKFIDILNKLNKYVKEVILEKLKPIMQKAVGILLEYATFKDRWNASIYSSQKKEEELKLLVKEHHALLFNAHNITKEQVILNIISQNDSQINFLSYLSRFFKLQNEEEYKKLYKTYEETPRDLLTFTARMFS